MPNVIPLKLGYDGESPVSIDELTPGDVIPVEYLPPATETSSGVSRRATMIDAIEGIGNEAHVTPMEAAAMTETKVNPKSQSQGFTLAAMRSGMYVPHNANIDFGTNDFSIALKGASPYWTQRRSNILISKHSAFTQKAPAAGTNYLFNPAVLGGKLYTVGSGVLYEWNGTDAWVSKAAAYSGQTTVNSIAAFDGKIYAATNNGGYLLEWDGVSAWVLKAPQYLTYIVSHLCEFNAELYCMAYSSTTLQHILLKWNGADAWVAMSDAFSSTFSTVNNLILYDGKLYASDSMDATLWEWDGVSQMVQKSQAITASRVSGQIIAGRLVVFNNALHCVVSGLFLYRWDGSDWVQVLEGCSNALNAQPAIPVVFNNELYCVLYIGGYVFKWDGVNDWQFVGSMNTTVSSTSGALVVFDNKLYLMLANNILLEKTTSTGYAVMVLCDHLVLVIGEYYFRSATTLSSFGVIDHQVLDIVASVTRERPESAGYVDMVVNMRAFDYQTIPAGDTINIANSGPLYLAGDACAIGMAGATFYTALFNRSVDLNEARQLGFSGVSSRDLGATQTVKYGSNFSAGADGWTGGSGGTLAGNIDGVNGRDNVLRFYANSTLNFHQPGRNNTTDLNKFYEIQFDYLLPIANTNAKKLIVPLDRSEFSGRVHPATDTWRMVIFRWFSFNTKYPGFYYLADADEALAFIGANSVTDDLFYLSNFTVKPIGCVALWEPNGIQPAPGQWLDSSGNNLHALQPAIGTSLVLSQKTFEVRWVNTWAGTHEAQYIGGVNQNILPPGAYIQDIIGIVSGSTGQNVIVGDGSDIDRFIESVPLVNGTQVFTPANRMLNGTNAKLVADPDANLTGSISWIIRGIIL